MSVDRVKLGIISHERIATSMAGPGIRCWEFARALGGDFAVTLFSPAGSDLDPEGFELAGYDRDDPGALAAAAGECDVLLAQGFTFNDHPALADMGRRLIIDLYVPLTLEAMGQYEHLPPGEQAGIQQGIIAALERQLEIGHFFICASERQRDFWLGWLSGAGRVTPGVYADDRTLRQLIDVVPFGLPETPPASPGGTLKGVHPGIGANDRVLLWGGGIYNWLDPFTPIRAVARLAEKRADVKLFFLGARHPDPGVPKMRAYDEAVQLSRELGVLDSAVFFNDKWVPYDERAGYLVEADLGVNANVDHIETRFAFRTRVLDCIWASLPLVSTHGDALSEMAGRRELGLIVASGDVDAYADAVERLLDDGELYASCRANIDAAAETFRWSRTTGPVRDYLLRLGKEGQESAAVDRLSPAVPEHPQGGDGSSGVAAAGNRIRHAVGKVKRRLK